MRSATARVVERFGPPISPSLDRQQADGASRDTEDPSQTPGNTEERRDPYRACATGAGAEIDSAGSQPRQYPIRVLGVTVVRSMFHAWCGGFFALEQFEGAQGLPVLRRVINGWNLRSDEA